MSAYERKNKIWGKTSSPGVFDDESFASARACGEFGEEGFVCIGGS